MARAAAIKIDIGANVGKLQSELKKASRSLSDFQKATQGIGKTLKIALGGVSLGASIFAVKKFSDAILDLAEAGDEASSIQSAFEKLGGSSSALDGAIQRTQGLIEKFDLMKAANEGLIRGIPDLNKHLADLADLAARFADAKGLNPTEVFGDLITALSSGKANALAKFGFDLSKAKGETQNTAFALNQLQEVLSRFDPVVLGAGDSAAVLKNTMATLRKELASGVDSSDQLKLALAGLNTAANSANLRDFGKSLGDLEAILIRLATNVLPTATEWIHGFAQGLDYLFTASDEAKLVKQVQQIDALKNKLNEARDDLAKAEKSPGGSLFSFSKEWISPNLKNNALERIDTYEKAIAERQKAYDAEVARIRQERSTAQQQSEEEFVKSQSQTMARLAELRKKYGLNEKTGTYSGGPGDSAEAAKKAAATLEKQLKITGENLKTNIEDAIKNINPDAFSFFKKQIFENTQAAFIAANKSLVEDGAITQAELGDLARAEAEKTVASYESQMQDAQDRLAQQMKQAHEEAVGAWTNVFERLFNGGDFDPTAAAKELATGFLSELMAGLVGGLNDNATSFYGVGKLIAQGLADTAKLDFSNLGATGGQTAASGGQSSGAGWGSIFSAIGSLFNSSNGMSFTGTAQNAAQNAEWNAAAMGQTGGSASSQAGAGAGAGAEAGGGSWAGWAAAALTVLGSAINAKGSDKASQSNAGTGGAVGGTVLGAIGAIFGPIGAAIGATIGQIGGTLIGGLFKWGPQNPDTQARHAFANFIEEGFKKLERVSFFDANGVVRNFNAQNLNFLEGNPNRFRPNGDTNGTNWGDNFQAMGQDVVTVFDGIGQAMEEVLGLTKDVGGQIGYLLAENLNGNIDNARLLVAQLGLSLEDMTNKLMEAGRTGEMSWLQVEVALQGVNQAFGEGLVAVGNVSGAFDEFIGSAGRGIAALKGVRDLAIESMEKGGRTLADLKNQLLQAGANPEVVDALINSIRGRGINSLEELKNANERVLGGIVADTNSSSQALTDQWAAVEGKINSLKGSLNELADNMVKNLTIKVSTEFDGKTQQAIDSGVFSQTPVENVTNQQITNPQTKTAQYRPTVPHSSSSIRSAGITMNIDARGAERGVQNDIVNSMAIMEKRIMTRTVDMIQSHISRGVM